MRSSRRVVVALVLLSLAGCGAGDGRATADQMALQRADIAAQAEENLHWALIMNATDVTVLQIEVARHRAAMASALAELRVCAEACGLVRFMNDLDALEEDHEERLAPLMTDLAAAQDECDRYARAMAAELHPMLGLDCA
jgi:hypothetical protein